MKTQHDEEMLQRLTQDKLGVTLVPLTAAARINLGEHQMMLSKQAVSREAAPVLPPFTAIAAELNRAKAWPGFNSAHEGYAILLEEVEELWDHVKTNQRKRDLVAMRAEAIQVAAMAVKFVEMIDAGKGRV